MQSIHSFNKHDRCRWIKFFRTSPNTDSRSRLVFKFRFESRLSLAWTESIISLASNIVDRAASRRSRQRGEYVARNWGKIYSFHWRISKMEESFSLILREQGIPSPSQKSCRSWCKSHRTSENLTDSSNVQREKHISCAYLMHIEYCIYHSHAPSFRKEHTEIKNGEREYSMWQRAKERMGNGHDSWSIILKEKSCRAYCTRSR